MIEQTQKLINDFKKINVELNTTLENAIEEISIKLGDNEGKLLDKNNLVELNKLIGGSKKLSLLYSGIEKKFSAQDFHKNVDDKFSILIMIKTNNHCLLGFKTRSFNPKKSRGKFIEDKDAFLFCLEIHGIKKTEIFPIKLECSHSAIFADNNIFFAVGEGYDLYIPDRCDSNPCTSDYPCSYTINNEELFKELKSFKVLELEAYLIDNL